MRINIKDAYSEITFCKEVIDMLRDPNDVYLNISCTEKVVTKKAINLLEEDQNSNLYRSQKNAKDSKKKVNKKSENKRKFSYHNMRKLSHFSLTIYIFFSFIFFFCFYFFNYYNSTLTNAKITELIDINKFFQELETLPTEVVMFNRLIIRNKILTNVLFNYPDKKTREQKIYGVLNERIARLSDTLDYIPKYSMNPELQKNKNVTSIVYGSICEILYSQKTINQDEFSVCIKTLNGVFNKGIVNVISELINTLKSEDFIVKPVLNLTPDEIKEQDIEILNVLKSNAAIDRIMTEYFLIRTFDMFKKGLQDYYVQLLLDQMVGLEAMIFILTIFMGIFSIISIILGIIYLKNLYLNVTLVLNVIPYEKILNDEQTNFLIKKFYKDY